MGWVRSVMETKGSLIERINRLAEGGIAPSGKEFRGLSLSAVETISSAMGVSRRDVEIAALEEGVIPLRYQRNIGSVGIEGQVKLRRARVAVVGAGGLGGLIIELLARLGIGTLVLIDGETFTEDNLNRQILCAEAGVGRSKVEAARQRVSEINSAVEVEIHNVFIRRDNIDALIMGCCLVIDALDSIPVRLILQEAAGRLGVPFVHGAVAGFVGEIMTVCPGDRGLAAFYEGGQHIPRAGIEVELGTPSVTPAVTAALQAMEAVKLITGRGELIRNKLLYLDLDESRMSEINLARS